MTQKPFLNLGCGRVILPAPKPGHYGLIDEGITDYALWHNVDRNPEPGVDECLDIFRYPFPWADNSFDGALLAHIAEHIPHEIRIVQQSTVDATFTDVDTWIDRAVPIYKKEDELANLQDGWYAFFAELHRVLAPGSIIHILSPYGWSQGGITDPTHTRYLTEHTFTHSMQPDANSPFKYATGGLNLELVEEAKYNYTNLAMPYAHDPVMLTRARQTMINITYELYVKLRVIK